jgi:hypothetical protein
MDMPLGINRKLAGEIIKKKQRLDGAAFVLIFVNSSQSELRFSHSRYNVWDCGIVRVRNSRL